MKILIPLLVLSSVVARSAIAHDSEKRVLDHLVFCSQLVMRNPDSGTSFNDMRNCCAYGDPSIAVNHMSNCCLYGDYLRDCYDWNRINR
jgi:hypothetical protein